MITHVIKSDTLLQLHKDRLINLSLDNFSFNRLTSFMNPYVFSKLSFYY